MTGALEFPPPRSSAVPDLRYLNSPIACIKGPFELLEWFRRLYSRAVCGAQALRNETLCPCARDRSQIRVGVLTKLKFGPGC